MGFNSILGGSGGGGGVSVNQIGYDFAIYKSSAFPITVPVALTTETSFPDGHGKYHGSSFNLELIGITFEAESSEASAIGDLTLQVRSTDVGGASQRVLGGGTLVKEQLMVSSAGVEALEKNKGVSVSFTPVPMVQNKFFYVDISGIGNYSFTGVKVILHVRKTL